MELIGRSIVALHALIGAVFLGALVGRVARAAHLYELGAVTVVFLLMVMKPF
jgi:hypothetical protein